MSRKFKALIHFFIDACADAPEKLGATRLNKALWFSDVFSFKLYERQITSERYIKRQLGPVPANILHALSDLVDENKIKILEPVSKFDCRKFISLVKPDTSLFEDRELETARYALDYVCSEAAFKISEITHDQIWHAAQLGHEIPVYATLASNIAPVTDDTIHWANKVILAHFESRID